MKVLIIEDDTHLREPLARALRIEGYQVLAAEDGKVLRDVSGVRRRREVGEQDRADRRRIPDTSTCTKPLLTSYGDWFPACLVSSSYVGGVGMTLGMELDAMTAKTGLATGLV